ncbi:MFS transporter [Sporolactobacillus sp. THM19-2]|uniref:MFS transporter n=1 Tax=Sporolactobacillus sp. THM19-2 TaxID=2511171 RepID=UPI0026AEB680|nr:MFS transporter [Sporolactobacillus sp. THM19-2]
METIGTIKRGTGAFWRAGGAVFAGSFITFANLYCTQPLLPVFSHQFHVTPTVSSLTLSVSSAVLAVCMLLAAALSERLGRRRIMILSVFVSSLVVILTAFSPNFTTLIILRLAEGVVLAGLPSLAMAYVSEEFEPGSLGVAMGLYVSGTTVGGMFGRIAAGMLTDIFSWRYALAVIGIVSLLCSVYFWLALPASTHFHGHSFSLKETIRSFGHHLKSPVLFSVFGIGFLLMGSFVSLYNYIGYLLTGAPYQLSQTAFGWIFTVYIMGTISSVWMGKLADRFGRTKVLGIGMIIMLTGGLLTLAPSLVVIVIGAAVFTFGFFGSHSVASSLVGRLAKSDRAQASSLYLLFYYAGSSLVGSINGVSWSLYRWHGVILMIGSAILLSMLLELFIIRFMKGHVD